MTLRPDVALLGQLRLERLLCLQLGVVPIVFALGNVDLVVVFLIHVVGNLEVLNDGFDLEIVD